MDCLPGVVAEHRHRSRRVCRPPGCIPAGTVTTTGLPTGLPASRLATANIRPNHWTPHPLGSILWAAPAVAVPHPSPEQQQAQGPRGCRGNPERWSVRTRRRRTAVRADRCRGSGSGTPGPLDRPLASKGKLDDDRVIELQQGQVAVGIDQHGASMPQPRSGSATGRGRRRRGITLSARSGRRCRRPPCAESRASPRGTGGRGRHDQTPTFPATR